MYKVVSQHTFVKFSELLNQVWGLEGCQSFLPAVHKSFCQVWFKCGLRATGLPLVLVEVLTLVLSVRVTNCKFVFRNGISEKKSLQCSFAQVTRLSRVVVSSADLIGSLHSMRKCVSYGFNVSL